MDPKKLPIILVPSALIVGATIFCVVAVLEFVNFKDFSFTFNATERSSLILPFCIMFGLCSIVSLIIPKFAKKRPGQTAFQDAFQKIIIQYALLEGAAFFGLVVLLDHYTENKATEFSFVWVGLIGYIFILIKYIKDFPELLRLMKSETSV